MQHPFKRFDFVITVDDGGEGSVRVTAVTTGDWSEAAAPDVLGSRFAAALPQRIFAWSSNLPPGPNGVDVIRRIALDVREPALHALALEEMIRAAVADGYDEIVRPSAVRPRVAAVALTLPLRVLVLDGAAQQVPQEIAAVFGATNAAKMNLAMVAEDRSIIEIKDFRSPSGWPVTDVIHFARLVADFDEERLLSSRAAEETGTLAWIARLADVWQTRLIVLDVDSDAQLAAARRLAAGIVRRGGPAVVIRPPDNPRNLYGQIVHDFPLDAMRHPAFGNVRWPVIFSLFGGEGREDLIRVSTIGERLSKMIADLPPPPVLTMSEEMLPMQSRNLFERRRSRSAIRDDLAPHLEERSTTPAVRRFAQTWKTMSFDLHESEGIIPLADALESLREAVGTVNAPAAPSTASRYVNASLWTATDGAPRKINGKSERLSIGASYGFQLQVGARDGDLAVYRSSALLEEHIKWTPEMTGVWVEIGVTGQGFQVEDEPLRDLWLPRYGPTEPVTFTVIPLIAIPVLRYTIYCSGNVVQSSRLAAIAGTNELAICRTEMAEALGIPLDELPPGTYVSRPDFSGGSVDDAASAPIPPRTIAIVVNHTHGKRRISVKGAGFLLDESAGDIEEFVKRTRNALFESSVVPDAALAREDWQYAFAADPALNGPGLLRALPQLAVAGWELYQRIFSHATRKKLEAALENETEATLSVAHVLLEEVIPWAAIYDRPYDKGTQDDGNGNPVAHEVCLAALPVGGKLPARRCGELPACLLHPDRLAERTQRGDPLLIEKTVACPLRFWGFRHVIEIPPQQADGDGKSLPRRTSIRTGKEVQLAAGVNTALSLSGPHVTKLAGLAGHGAVWRHSAINRRDALLKALEEDDLDIIYFYCHARGGLADPATKPEHLELQEDKKTPVGIITAADLDFDPEWSHAPLVFLNGCSTAAFSPDAMSPFVRTFVRDRGASGVVGTEIPVNELLAGEVAYAFFERFLGRANAGDALLAVRRALLENRNPLGLVYTLYAYAELAITKP